MFEQDRRGIRSVGYCDGGPPPAPLAGVHIEETADEYSAPTPPPLFLDFQSECRRQRLVNVASWKPVFDGWRQYFGNRRADARRDARKRDGVKPPNPQRVLAKYQPGLIDG